MTQQVESMQLNSVEGHIAQVCYGMNIGDWAFKRITPIARILFWAGVIEDPKGHNYLQLVP